LEGESVGAISAFREGAGFSGNGMILGVARGFEGNGCQLFAFGVFGEDDFERDTWFHERGFEVLRAKVEAQNGAGGMRGRGEEEEKEAKEKRKGG